MLFRVCLCALLIACAPALAASAPRVGEAAVRLSGGLPCFTIAEQEEGRSGAPAFYAIRVLDAGSKPAAVVWAMTMPAGRSFPLTFNMCIPYGGRVPSLPQQSAELLEEGRPYEVEITLRAADPAQRPGQLAARFCLARQSDGSKTVQLLGPKAICGANVAPTRKGTRR